jgi:hypothetical protein
MCQPGIAAKPGKLAGGCCGYGPSCHAFPTTEGELEQLKNYRDQLENELAGVRERIGEIGKA